MAETRGSRARGGASILPATRLGQRVVALGLAALACSPHHEPAATGGGACPGLERNPALLKRIQGRWTVAFADYRPGQKPPTKARLGELEFVGCRYQFILDAAAKEVGSRAWRELALARRELPFLDAAAGQVEVLDGGRGLGGIRLHPGDGGGEGADAAASWTVSVLERPQEGEYLYFVGEGYRWSVSRGVWRWRDDEYIPGSSPFEARRSAGTLGRMSQGSGERPRE